MGEEPNNNNLEPNEEPQNESQTPDVPEGTDPLDSNFYQIGDGNLNLRFITLNTIEFIKTGNDLSKPTINLALGNGSGANTVVYDTQQQMENGTNVVDKMFAYRTDLKGLFIRIKGEWKQITSVSAQDDGQGNISYVNLHYAEKDKNEEIEGTWTFKENTAFEKNVNASQVITDTIHSNGASSGLEGSGYMVYKDLNDKYILDIDKIFVRETLEAQEYKINKVTATNGTLYVSDASKISNLEAAVYNIPVSDADYFTTFTGNIYKVYIEENVFSQYDVLECQYVESDLNVKNYLAVVLHTDYTTPEEGFIYIKLKLSGIQPKVEDVLVRTNNLVNDNRKGIIYLTSSMSNAPYIEVRGSDNHKVRLGNLGGIDFNGEDLLSGYGLFADNVYLKGKFVLSNGDVLTKYDDTGITNQVGNLRDDLIGLGSRVTQTEQEIQSLVSDSGIILEKTLSNPNLEITQSGQIYSESISNFTGTSGETLNFDIDYTLNGSAEITFKLVNSENTPISDEIDLKSKGCFVLNSSISNLQIYIRGYCAEGFTSGTTITLRTIKLYRNRVISEIRQTADNIHLSVKNDLSESGIDINSKSITAKTNNFKITDSTGENVTFEIGNNGNIIAKNGAKIEGILLIPFNSINSDFDGQNRIDYIDLNDTSSSNIYTNPLKNIQIDPRVSLWSINGNVGYMMTIMLPGFKTIQDDIYENNLYYVDEYGESKIEPNVTDKNVLNLDDGTELEIYHLWANVYPLLKNIVALNGPDSALNISTLILADNKLSGNVYGNLNTNNYITHLNLLGLRTPAEISSGWIVSGTTVAKGILLNPGFSAKLKSVKCFGIYGKITGTNNLLYHTNVWKLLNPEEFVPMLIDIDTIVDETQTVSAKSIKVFVSKEIFGDNPNSNNYIPKLTLTYDSTGKLILYTWE